MFPNTTSVRRSLSTGHFPRGSGADFYRCLRRRLPESGRTEGLPWLGLTLLGLPGREAALSPSGAIPAAMAPKPEVELLSERLYTTCLQARTLNQPMEIVLPEGWLQGSRLWVEWNGQSFHCRISVPAARARQQLKRALDRIVSRLHAGGLPLGCLEVLP